MPKLVPAPAEQTKSQLMNFDLEDSSAQTTAKIQGDLLLFSEMSQPPPVQVQKSPQQDFGEFMVANTQQTQNVPENQLPGLPSCNPFLYDHIILKLGAHSYPKEEKIAEPITWNKQQPTSAQKDWFFGGNQQESPEKEMGFGQFQNFTPQSPPQMQMHPPQDHTPQLATKEETMEFEEFQEANAQSTPQEALQESSQQTTQVTTTTTKKETQKQHKQTSNISQGESQHKRRWSDTDDLFSLENLQPTSKAEEKPTHKPPSSHYSLDPMAAIYGKQSSQSSSQSSHNTNNLLFSKDTDFESLYSSKSHHQQQLQQNMNMKFSNPSGSTSFNPSNVMPMAGMGAMSRPNYPPMAGMPMNQMSMGMGMGGMSSMGMQYRPPAFNNRPTPNVNVMNVNSQIPQMNINMAPIYPSHHAQPPQYSNPSNFYAFCFVF